MSVFYPLRIAPGRYAKRVGIERAFDKVAKYLGGSFEFVPLTEDGGLLVLTEQKDCKRKKQVNFYVENKVFSAEPRAVRGPALLVGIADDGFTAPSEQLQDAFGERCYRL